MDTCKFQYVREMNHSYMVFQGDINEKDYEVQMILHNQINGLLDCKMKKVDGNVELCYEISGKQSLKHGYEKKKMDYIQLKKLFTDLHYVIKQTEDYLLSMEYLVVEPDKIYMEIEKLEFGFCLIPVRQKDAGSFCALLEFILDSVDYADEKAVAVAYELYKKAGVDNFSFEKVYEEVFCREEMDQVREKEKKSLDKPVIAEDNSAKWRAESNRIDESDGKNGKGKSDESEGKSKREAIRDSTKLSIGIVLAVGIVAIVSIVCIILNIYTNLMIKFLAVAVVCGITVIYMYYRKNQEADYEYVDLEELGVESPGLEDWKEFMAEEAKSEKLGRFAAEEAKSEKLGRFAAEEAKSEKLERFAAEEAKSEKLERFAAEEAKSEKLERFVAEESEHGDFQLEKGEKYERAEEPYGATQFFTGKSLEKIRVLHPVTENYTELRMEVFPYIIGKMREAVDGVVVHETVSRIHCKIEYKDGEYVVTDLNSTNGTVINGVAIHNNEKAVLQIGDEIRLGQVVYRFQ